MSEITLRFYGEKIGIADFKGAQKAYDALRARYGADAVEFKADAEGCEVSLSLDDDDRADCRGIAERAHKAAGCFTLADCWSEDSHRYYRELWECSDVTECLVYLQYRADSTLKDDQSYFFDEESGRILNDNAMPLTFRIKARSADGKEIDVTADAKLGGGRAFVEIEGIGQAALLDGEKPTQGAYASGVELGEGWELLSIEETASNDRKQYIFFREQEKEHSQQTAEAFAKWEADKRAEANSALAALPAFPAAEPIAGAHPCASLLQLKKDLAVRISLSGAGGVELLLSASKAKMKKWEAALGGLLEKAESGGSREEILALAAENGMEDTSKKYLTIKDGILSKCKKEAVHITIPEGVTEIGHEAFKGNESLVSVAIPEGVTEIGHGTFRGCASLASVTIPEGVTEIGWDAFYGCKSLASLAIPEGVKKIGGWAFGNCASLASVTIPEGVTEIGWYAFDGCTSLASVTIPEGVTEIGDRAFDGCTSLASVTIPEGVTEIGDRAFGDCESLASVTIPPSVTKIGKLAFQGCAIEELNHPCLTIKDGLAAQNDKLLYLANAKATEITIPEGVTEIGWDAFYGCKSLASLAIPEGVTKIGGNAFGDCASLASVTIPPSVTKIDNYAFRSCTSLASVTIPASVTEIGMEAFRDCASLASVTIPEGVTIIGLWAFQNCTSLAEITFGGTMKQWKAVKKGDDWNEGVPAKSVKCSDGETAL